MKRFLCIVALYVMLPGSLFSQKVCLVFDGVDDYIEVPNTASMQISGAITLEAFVKVEGWSVQSAVISKVNDYGWDNGWELFVSNPSGVGSGDLIVVSTPGGINAGGTSWTAVGLGEWVHVAAVYDLTEWRTYVNGVMTQGESASGSTNAAVNPLRFGRRGGAGIINNWFCGRIESVRISPIARYAGSFSPPTDFVADANTAGLWLMDEAEGTVAHDASGNGNDGTIYGAVWTSDGPAPVTLTTFEGKLDPSATGIVLTWRTASEVYNYGFTVQRRKGGETEFCDVAGSFVAGAGTTTEPRSYTFTDLSLPGAGRYAYRLKQQDQDGALHFSQTILVDALVSAAEQDRPRRFELTQNYPNPFNPSTRLTVVLPERSRAIVKVFDVLGTEVATMMDGVLDPGVYGLTFDGTGLPSGTYFCRLQSEGYVQNRRMMLIK